MFVICTFAVLIACLGFVSEGIVVKTSSTRDEIVETVFKQNISHVRPGELTHNQTVVIVYISIAAITSVDVRNMEYTVDMLLRQKWHDPRLGWKHIPKFSNYTKNIVSPVFRNIIWLPDLFFRNGKQGMVHTMTCDNLLIRIEPDGHVLYSQKITMRMDCQMDLRTFPMDTQSCAMNIGSYGYTLDELSFVWRTEEPVKFPDDMQISEFDPPKKMTPNDCTAGYSTSTGRYTCLNVTFSLSRQLGYWFASTYIPNILIMVVSWLNFWVSLDAVPARVNLSLLTLLGVITQSTGYSSSLPRVSYIKAIDIWTIACIAFNSGVLLEFAIASHISRRHKLSEWHGEVRKMVRRELVKWCYACQQQYSQRGPSACMSYLSGSRANEKTMECVNSAAAAAYAIQNLDASESPQMTVRLTNTGQLSVGSNRKSSVKSPNVTCKYDRGNPLESTIAEPLLSGVSDIESAQALLPLFKAKIMKKPAPISKIDSYSRFLFPACFILYNCFYWVYYLVIVKQT